MTYLTWLVTLALLATQPDFRCRADRRTFDSERYTALCAGLYQRPTTWACLDVPR